MTETMTTQIRMISRSGRLPSYATPGSAGADLRAYLTEPVTLAPGERRLIPTGLYVELPIKHGIGLVNGVGTVDSDYRGEWNVPLINFGDQPYTIHDGDRIAQVVFARYERAEFTLVDEIAGSERGAGGFGHTGSN